MTEHWHYGHRWLETPSWQEFQWIRFMNATPSHVLGYTATDVVYNQELQSYEK